jgi:DNA-binding response OmpR family regulator
VNTGNRVLVVEDEPDIAGLIKHSLEKMDRLTVDVAESGDAAIRAVAELTPDLIILDLNLPVLSGIEVCRILRQRPLTAAVPIIMLTARVSEHDRVVGLDVGADDYMTKPFGLKELSARVRALLRRRTTGTAREPEPFVYRGARLVADFDAVAVSVDTEAIRLTRREFDLLRHLVENKNRVLSRDRLSSASGDTSASWTRGRWTYTSAGCAPSWARRVVRSRPSSDSAIASLTEPARPAPQAP